MLRDKKDYSYDSKVGSKIEVVFYLVIIVGILAFADRMGVDIIGIAQGWLGMVLIVSPNWDGFDTQDEWEFVEWERCPVCGEWYAVEDEYAYADHITFDCGGE